MPTPRLDYTPPLRENQIRVLAILPSEDPEARVECNLERTSLNSPCKYTCLSYSCSDRDDGVVEFCETIICDGEEIGVTKGAHNAMRRFRQLKGDRIWVDAICIDQKNDKERSQQVAIMAEIYTAARTVFVWLGDESSQCDGWHAMTCFTGMGYCCHRHGQVVRDRYIGLQDFLTFSWLLGRWIQSRSRGPFKLFQVTDTTRQRYHSRDYPSHIRRIPISVLERKYNDDMELIYPLILDFILKFLQRRWFGRRWILQEIRRARSVSLHCGAMSLDFATFARGMQILEVRVAGTGWRSWHLASLYRAKHIVDLKTRGHPSSALSIEPNTRKVETPADLMQRPAEIMHRCDGFDCSDDRDKIFALLSFFGSSTISPDYSLTVETTYYSFAKSLLASNQLGLTMWQAALRAAKDPNEARTMPSWVPDWRNKPNMAIDPSSKSARYSFGAAKCDARYNVNTDGSLSLEAWICNQFPQSSTPISFRRCRCSSVDSSGFPEECTFVPRRIIDCDIAITHGGVVADDAMLTLSPLTSSLQTCKFIMLRSVCRDAASYRIVGWCVVSYGTPVRIGAQAVTIELV